MYFVSSIARARAVTSMQLAEREYEDYSNSVELSRASHSNNDWQLKTNDSEKSRVAWLIKKWRNEGGLFRARSTSFYDLRANDLQ